VEGDTVGDYTDALAKDLKRIEAELKQIDAALKKNPNDAAALKKKKAVLPFLEEKALQKRFDNARAMDAQAMKKQFKYMGL
jgi:septal ring factor EnvC (AmiA/AmiB activator)